MGAWEGYWYLSEGSIQTLLGDRFVILEPSPSNSSCPSTYEIQQK